MYESFGKIIIIMVLSASSRRGPGQEYVKSSLGSVIEKLVDMSDPLELHPIKVNVLLDSLLMYVCMSVCLCVYVSICLYVCMPVCVSVCICVCNRR